MGHDGGMPTWKPHSLARPRPDQLDLRIGDKVTAKVDLPGVPEGTPGKVILANGFNWLRYRVRFEGGVGAARSGRAPPDPTRPHRPPPRPQSRTSGARRLSATAPVAPDRSASRRVG